MKDLQASYQRDVEQLRNTMLDPAVNVFIKKLKEELKQAQERLRQAQESKEAEEFNPQSLIGKKLMAKCKVSLCEGSVVVMWCGRRCKRRMRIWACSWRRGGFKSWRWSWPCRNTMPVS